MSRTDRIKEYAAMKGPDGAARSQKNLDQWSARASDLSNTAHRAKGGDVKLPDTGNMTLHDTADAARSKDPRAQAKKDLNHSDSSPYLRGIRRNA